jgi:hypothetical protein
MRTEGLGLVSSESVRYLTLNFEILNNNKSSQVKSSQVNNNEADQRVSPAVTWLPIVGLPSVVP